MDLAPPVSVKLDLHPLLMLTKQVPPCGIPDPFEGGCGLDDVGEEQRHQDSLSRPRHGARIGSRTSEVERHPRIVTHNPGVVTGWDLVHHVGTDFELASIGQLHLEPAGERDAQVVVGAAVRPDRGLDINRPAPAGLHHHAADHDVVELVDLGPSAGEVRSDLVRLIQLLALEAGHLRRILPRRAGRAGGDARLQSREDRAHPRAQRAGGLSLAPGGGT